MVNDIGEFLHLQIHRLIPTTYLDPYSESEFLTQVSKLKTGNN